VIREPLKLVLFKTANIDFGLSLVGEGVGFGLSVSLLARVGVALGRSSGVGDFSMSGV